MGLAVFYVEMLGIRRQPLTYRREGVTLSGLLTGEFIHITQTPRRNPHDRFLMDVWLGLLC